MSPSKAALGDIEKLGQVVYDSGSKHDSKNTCIIVRHFHGIPMHVGMLRDDPEFARLFIAHQNCVRSFCHVLLQRADTHLYDYELTKLLGSFRQAAWCIVHQASHRVHGIEPNYTVEEMMELEEKLFEYEHPDQRNKRKRAIDVKRTKSIVEIWQKYASQSLKDFVGVLVIGAAHTQSGIPACDPNVQPLEDVFAQELSMTRLMVVQPNTIGWDYRSRT